MHSISLFSLEFPVTRPRSLTKYTFLYSLARFLKRATWRASSRQGYNTFIIYPWSRQSTRELEAPPSLHSARDSRVSKKTIVELAFVYIHQLKCQLRRDDGEEGDVEVKGKQNRRRLRRGSCSQLLRHLTCRLGRLLRLVTTATLLLVFF